MEPMSNTTEYQETESEPLKQCMDMLDGYIEAGGASVEDLQNLKMDLEDAQAKINREETVEPGMEESQEGMVGMLEKMREGA